MNNVDALNGRRIGVPESRQLDLFADMLERRGALVTRCPLVDIRDAPDAGPINRWFDDIIAHGLTHMIWLTGEGVRRLQGFAERRGESVAERFWAHIGQAQNIARGPKPGRALRPLAIRIDRLGREPTTPGVIDTLAGLDLRQARVGVQLYGTEPNRPLMDALAHAGATALPVAPYVYADQGEDSAVQAFIDSLCAGELDAVAFTSSAQVKRLFKVARRTGRETELGAALAQCCVAAVGPLIAQTLVERGITTDLMPDTHFFMKPLVRALTDYFQQPSSV